MRFISPSIVQRKKLKFWNSSYYLKPYNFSYVSVNDYVVLSYIYGIFNIDKLRSKFRFFLKHGFLLCFIKFIKFYKDFFILLYFNKILTFFKKKLKFKKKKFKKNKYKKLKLKKIKKKTKKYKINFFKKLNIIKYNKIFLRDKLHKKFRRYNPKLFSKLKSFRRRMKRYKFNNKNFKRPKRNFKKQFFLNKKFYHIYNKINTKKKFNKNKIKNLHWKKQNKFIKKKYVINLKFIKKYNNILKHTSLKTNFILLKALINKKTKLIFKKRKYIKLFNKLLINYCYDKIFYKILISETDRTKSFINYFNKIKLSRRKLKALKKSFKNSYKKKTKNIVLINYLKIMNSFEKLISVLPLEDYEDLNDIFFSKYFKKTSILSVLGEMLFKKWDMLFKNNKTNTHFKFFKKFKKIKKFIKKIKKKLKKKTKKGVNNLLFFNDHYFRMFENSRVYSSKNSIFRFIKKVLLFYVTTNFFKLFIIKIIKNFYSDSSVFLNIYFIFLKNNVIRSYAICNFIYGRLKRRYKITTIFYSLRSLFKTYMSLNFIKGYKILLMGRFTRNDRAAYLIKNIKLSSNNRLKKIDFHHKLLRLKHGACSAKIWLWK